MGINLSFDGSPKLVLECDESHASSRLWWSNYQGHMGDVLASKDDEGRGSLRKAWGSWQTSYDPEIPE